MCGRPSLQMCPAAYSLDACSLDAYSLDACSIDACSIDACSLDCWCFTILRARGSGRGVGCRQHD